MFRFSKTEFGLQLNLLAIATDFKALDVLRIIILPNLECNNGIMCDTSENSDEDPVANPEFVQIVAPFREVNCWISSFIHDKREQINLQNVQDFCVAPELRQNCARIDAVLVKRKGTTSHITVKDIKNYCGPQEKGHNPAISSQSYKIVSNKKVFTSEDVDNKIKKLQPLFSSSCESSSSGFPLSGSKLF